MAIEDVIPPTRTRKTSYPPSRIRGLLKALVRDVALEPLNDHGITSLKSGPVTWARIAKEANGALDLYEKLDELEYAVATQRARIQKMLPKLVAFLYVIRLQLRNRHPRKRRPLTPEQKVLAAAAAARTRAQRGTLGKRQKAKRFPGSRKRK